MGRVTNGTPIYMSDISGSLGGTNDLNYYRGRQYWDASDVSITMSSGAISMSSFMGVTNVQPAKLVATMQSVYWSDGYNHYYGYYAAPDVGYFGSLSPQWTTFGLRVCGVYTMTDGQYITVDIDTTYDPGQGCFSALHIPGIVYLTTASTTYYYNWISLGANSVSWNWNVNALYFTTGTYTVRLEN